MAVITMNKLSMVRKEAKQNGLVVRELKNVQLNVFKAYALYDRATGEKKTIPMTIGEMFNIALNQGFAQFK